MKDFVFDLQRFVTVSNNEEFAALISEDGIIKLTEDLTINGFITFDRSFTLDLNGHNINLVHARLTYYCDDLQRDSHDYTVIVKGDGTIDGIAGQWDQEYYNLGFLDEEYIQMHGLFYSHRSNELIIQGGTWNVNPVEGVGENIPFGIKVTIIGGTFNKFKLTQALRENGMRFPGRIKILDGTFSKDLLSEYGDLVNYHDKLPMITVDPESTQSMVDGKWVVTYLACVSDNEFSDMARYKTMQEAINAGDLEIKLLKNVNENITIKDDWLTISENGYGYSGTVTIIQESAYYARFAPTKYRDLKIIKGTVTAVYKNSALKKVTGSSGTDKIASNHDYATIDAGAGDDVVANEYQQHYFQEGGSGIFYPDHVSINGGDGNDAIYNQGSYVTIDGGAGNDKLYGGKGNDSLWGDAGKDTFFYTANEGTDRIFDYEAGDILKILNVDGSNSSFKSSKFSGGDLTLTINGGGKIIFEDVSASTKFNINGSSYIINGSKLTKK